MGGAEVGRESLGLNSGMGFATDSNVPDFWNAS
jgi:hypothetical protein